MHATAYLSGESAPVPCHERNTSSREQQRRYTGACARDDSQYFVTIRTTAILPEQVQPAIFISQDRRRMWERIIPIARATVLPKATKGQLYSEVHCSGCSVVHCDLRSAAGGQRMRFTKRVHEEKTMATPLNFDKVGTRTVSVKGSTIV